jgi:pimeloyl-ACP methyl ester carboxylesterase
MQEQTELDTRSFQRPVSLLWVSGVGQRKRVWDGWGTKGPATYAYLRAAIDGARQAGATPRTIIVVGMSMGAVQAMMLGCAMPETFAGVVSVAGNDSYRCRMRVERPLLAIGGVGDTSIGGTEGTHRVVHRWLAEATTCTSQPGLFIVGSWNYCGWKVMEIVVEHFAHGWPLPPDFDTDAAIVTFAWAVDGRTQPQRRSPVRAV